MPKIQWCLVDTCRFGGFSVPLSTTNKNPGWTETFPCRFGRRGCTLLGRSTSIFLSLRATCTSSDPDHWELVENLPAVKTWQLENCKTVGNSKVIFSRTIWNHDTENAIFPRCPNFEGRGVCDYVYLIPLIGIATKTQSDWTFIR